MNTPELKRAVIYLRVSTEKQAGRDRDPEGYSIPAQRDACRRKAATLGAVVIDEYLDRGESARSSQRPALQQMLKRVESDRDVDLVVVHKVDRLARNRADDVTINLALQAAGVQLVSVSENIDETPSGMLLHGIMSSIAEFYSRNLATEIIKGTTQKVRTGGTPNMAPLGYVNVRKTVDGHETRTVEVDAERAVLVRWAFEQYATGNWSLRSMLEELNKRGLTMRSTRKRAERPLSLAHLARVLKNPYYIGTVLYRGAQYEGKHEKHHHA